MASRLISSITSTPGQILNNSTNSNDDHWSSQRPFIKKLISECRPSSMMELDTCIGYSVILFSESVVAHGGR
ncbi:O-methyltransferase family 3 [Penicillium atrosanguineum]|uniref:O-methyltransferase family 3 n=1 Tax=Penicillium atrosanguineum TaxID=1132637 RepID=A0A9W9H917_9EURO|nr:O-methyltransferase [Penicillium atrosanguineum]KAJ5117107.1 O-methyltransferase family 3 [Penicillium atrosanguineum]KAJ5140648.1 O-methyltransferase family 3 [Penicillium atrosanguineum]KAJ5310557.1 O-methyltransferase [Penicillium atrosanguineum]KAJ5316078.1 O-methyltransferase family 3 [Penicillium atrosanguineum]